MKRFIAGAVILSLAACSSTKGFETKTESKEVRTFESKTSGTGDGHSVFPTIPDFEVRALTRTEVIQAVDQCNDNGMKPFVEYLAQKTPYGRVMTPVNVHCNPNRRVN